MDRLVRESSGSSAPPTSRTARYDRRVRIAVSGSHRVGKSTLVERVGEELPDHVTVEEPYYLLEEDGYECAESPSLEDFEEQLKRSLLEIEEGPADAIFDRCPADILAYLATHDDGDSFDPDDWLDEARAAMKTLDLVVFVPIEARDRIRVPAHEDAGLRQAVDDELREILVDDRWGFEVEVLVVEGDPGERVAQIMARVERGARRGKMQRPKKR